MKILIDIGHPGHVHLFRPFAKEILRDARNEILFTCRQKEYEIELLKSANFNYISFGKHYKKKLWKMWGLVKFDIKMFFTSLKFKPDVYLSAGSMYAAQVAWLLRKPHIAMEDTGNMEQIKFYLPFTNTVLSPYKLNQNLGPKQIKYNAFHELAYLSSKYFKPDEKIYDFLKISKNEKFAILRFVSWNATHDFGQGGFTSDEKDEIVEYLSQGYTLFISSEGIVPSKFEKYLIQIPPEKIHDAMAFAHLVVSEGATMAAEAGVLGTPAIYVNSLRAANNENLEAHNLVFNFRSGKGVLNKIKELENISNRDIEFKKRLNNFLADKIDLTTLLVWLIINYPNSTDILQQTKNYQFEFKL